MYRKTAVIALAIMLSVSAAAAMEAPGEANVDGVDYEWTGNDYTFWVTIYNEPDADGGSVTNQWTVETGDGTVISETPVNQLSNETSINSNGTANVPNGTEYLIVRGRDTTEGYGGQTVIIDLVGEDFTRIDQEAEPLAADELLGRVTSTGEDGSSGDGGGEEDGDGAAAGAPGENTSDATGSTPSGTDGDTQRDGTTDSAEDPRGQDSGTVQTGESGETGEQDEDAATVPRLVLVIVVGIAIATVVLALKRRRSEEKPTFHIVDR